MICTCPGSCLLFTAPCIYLFYFLFSADSATTEIYTLSLHDALPINALDAVMLAFQGINALRQQVRSDVRIHGIDRKSTRLNSSHEWISYAVFCLKKKNKGDEGVGYASAQLLVCDKYNVSYDYALSGA